MALPFFIPIRTTISVKFNQKPPFRMISVFLVVFFISGTISSFAQTNGWYTASEIGVKTWVISEPGFNEKMYLLEGKDSALLIDAGFGMGNLRDFVKMLSTKPLIVANTHSHPDHTGGDYEFSAVYIGAEDLELAKPYLDPKVMKNITGSFLKNIQIPDSLKFPDTLNAISTRLVAVADNYIFHLGVRDVQVISLPGHTPGSLCFLDRNSKILFTGDNNVSVWLFPKESLPVATYLKSLKKLNTFNKQFNTIYSGHDLATPIGIIDELITCCELIISGKCETKPYHTMFGTDTPSCNYKSVTIAYDPNKIK
jgi:glyoxylase-like metal-dependent hydrolase (beta-lactamase superfamily II)